MEYLEKVCPCCNNIFETTKTNKVYCDSVCSALSIVHRFTK